jgi:hypothetical protein
VAPESVRVQLRLIRSAVAPLGHLLDDVDTEET